VIGGNGGGVALSTAGSQITGGVTTQTLGTLVLGATAGDVPALSPARSRTIQVPIFGAHLHVDVGAIGQSLLEESYVTSSLGASVYGVTVQRPAGAPAGTLFIEVPPRYMHSGGRIATITLQFQLLQRVPIPSTTLLIGTRTGGVGNVFVPSTPLNSLSILQWVASASWTVGNYVVPLAAAKQNGFYFKCTTGGTSGATEPTWTSTVGSTVSDGSVVWTCIGRSGRLATANQTIDTYFNNGATQSVSWDLDGSAGNVADTQNNRLYIYVANLDPTTTSPAPAPTILVTGASILFDSISSLAFA